MATEVFRVKVKLLLLTLLLSSAASSFFCRFSSEASFLWAARYRLWGLSGDRSIGLFRVISKAWPDVCWLMDFTAMSMEGNQQCYVTKHHTFSFYIVQFFIWQDDLFCFAFYFSLEAHWYSRTCSSWFSSALHILLSTYPHQCYKSIAAPHTLKVSEGLMMRLRI